MSTELYAVQHIRRMRGGSQAHLMRASDGHYFVVKFQNNPQHIRVLANEMFATRLGIAAWKPCHEPCNFFEPPKTYVSPQNISACSTSEKRA